MRSVTWTVLAGAVVGWVAAPWVSMARRGTIDQRTVAAWSRERGPAPEIPEPRRPADDAAERHTPTGVAQRGWFDRAVPRRRVQ